MSTALALRLKTCVLLAALILKKLSGRHLRSCPSCSRAGCPFKIRIAGSRAGRWADFATGDSGGDPIALAAYLFQLSQNQAAKKIAHMLGVRDV